MSTAIEKLKSFKERRNELAKEIQATGKALFIEAVANLFTEFPDLKAFSWKQYTPYFNDGDTCEFEARTDYPEIQYGNDEELEEFYFNEFDYVADGYETQKDWRGVERQVRKTKCVPKSHTPEAIAKNKANKAVSEFLNLLSDDDFLAMFGDHVQVIVTRGQDSPKIEVEEYNHD
jgi:hypothetical protein